ncbi:rhamnogalacturonan acetylesterase [Lysobacter sp. TAB13]|uniref:rhamnogalacturonan acetylesterase n=1 Tax=Lysobacter sp. TAB13 TaxID=3233065 RepID=UPI003F9CF271
MAPLRAIVWLALWLSGLPINAIAADAPTLHLAGDSTIAVKREEKRPETGWGEAIGEAFADGRVRIDNRAMNGRSTRTFIDEGRWQALLDTVAAGDYVLIQFGHNDQSRNKPDRYTPPADYRSNLERFVDQTRARGATAILLTPVARRRFDPAGAVAHSHGEYPDIVRAVAAEREVALIDLERRSEAVLAWQGAEDSKRLFLWLRPGDSANYPDGLQDDTHFSPQGARCMAAEVADGLRSLRLPLTRMLKRPLPARCLRTGGSTTPSPR